MSLQVPVWLARRCPGLWSVACGLLVLTGLGVSAAVAKTPSPDTPRKPEARPAPVASESLIPQAYPALLVPGRMIVPNPTRNLADNQIYGRLGLCAEEPDPALMDQLDLRDPLRRSVSC